MPKVRFTVRGQWLKPDCAITSNLQEQIVSNFTKKKTLIRRCVTHNIYVPKLKVNVTIWDQRSNYIHAITLKSTKVNVINIPRQIRHNERVCHAQDTQGQGPG